jgi:2-polyprenyl-3-methyl-5-hydroxy-6-metoxy-1,4-benzoquinol methylase
MGPLLSHIISKIELTDPMHAKKLKSNLLNLGDSFNTKAEIFIKRVEKFLEAQGKDIDYGIECYSRVCSDTMFEQIQFAQTDTYSSQSFNEVNERVYNNPSVMEYYMNGLLLTQFLWYHHYKMLTFFTKTLYPLSSKIQRYLEVGGGHGLQVSEAISMLPSSAIIDLVDISASSIKLAKHFIGESRVNYFNVDIFNFNAPEKYDFISMGEVLEHVESPLALLQRLSTLVKRNGYVFITTPANAPAIDHIYLFRNAAEIREIISTAGFDIVNEHRIYTEAVSEERAEKLKITQMYGALLRLKTLNRTELDRKQR